MAGIFDDETDALLGLNPKPAPQPVVAPAVAPEPVAAPTPAVASTPEPAATSAPPAAVEPATPIAAPVSGPAPSPAAAPTPTVAVVPEPVTATVPEPVPTPTVVPIPVAEPEPIAPVAAPEPADARPRVTPNTPAVIGSMVTELPRPPAAAASTASRETLDAAEAMILDIDDGILPPGKRSGLHAPRDAAKIIVNDDGSIAITLPESPDTKYAFCESYGVGLIANGYDADLVDELTTRFGNSDGLVDRLMAAFKESEVGKRLLIAAEMEPAAGTLRIGDGTPLPEPEVADRPILSVGTEPIRGSAPTPAAVNDAEVIDELLAEANPPHATTVMPAIDLPDGTHVRRYQTDAHLHELIQRTGADGTVSGSHETTDLPPDQVVSLIRPEELAEVDPNVEHEIPTAPLPIPRPTPAVAAFDINGFVDEMFGKLEFRNATTKAGVVTFYQAALAKGYSEELLKLALETKLSTYSKDSRTYLTNDDLFPWKTPDRFDSRYLERLRSFGVEHGNAALAVLRTKLQEAGETDFESLQYYVPRFFGIVLEASRNPGIGTNEQIVDWLIKNGRTDKGFSVTMDEPDAKILKMIERDLAPVKTVAATTERRPSRIAEAVEAAKKRTQPKLSPFGLITATILGVIGIAIGSLWYVSAPPSEIKPEEAQVETTNTREPQKAMLDAIAGGDRETAFYHADNGTAVSGKEILDAFLKRLNWSYSGDGKYYEGRIAAMDDLIKRRGLAFALTALEAGTNKYSRTTDGKAMDYLTLLGDGERIVDKLGVSLAQTLVKQIISELDGNYDTTHYYLPKMMAVLADAKGNEGISLANLASYLVELAKAGSPALGAVQTDDILKSYALTEPAKADQAKYAAEHKRAEPVDAQPKVDPAQAERDAAAAREKAAMERVQAERARVDAERARVEREKRAKQNSVHPVPKSPKPKPGLNEDDRKMLEFLKRMEGGSSMRTPPKPFRMLRYS